MSDPSTPYNVQPSFSFGLMLFTMFSGFDLYCRIMTSSTPCKKRYYSYTQNKIKQIGTVISIKHILTLVLKLLHFDIC